LKREFSKVKMSGADSDGVARELGLSKHAIYDWNAKYDVRDMNEVRRLRQIQDERQRPKKLVADLSLDKVMLKAVIAKNGRGPWACTKTCAPCSSTPGEPGPASSRRWALRICSTRKLMTETGTKLRWFDFGRRKKGTNASVFKTELNMTTPPLNYQRYLLGRQGFPNFRLANPRDRHGGKGLEQLPWRLTSEIGPRIVKCVP
jgi:putative transposase